MICGGVDMCGRCVGVDRVDGNVVVMCGIVVRILRVYGGDVRCEDDCVEKDMRRTSIREDRVCAYVCQKWEIRTYNKKKLKVRAYP